MKFRIIAASALCLALASSAYAIPESQQSLTLAQRADANAHKITSAERLIGELEQSVDLAHDGEYGKISKKDIKRLDEARDTIVGLLEGHDHGRQLDPEQRIELYNAQLLVTSIIRDDQKNRRICKRVKGTGTRLAKAECMTVEQREARAREARNNTIELQRPSALQGN